MPNKTQTLRPSLSEMVKKKDMQGIIEYIKNFFRNRALLVDEDVSVDLSGDEQVGDDVEESGLLDQTISYVEAQTEVLSAYNKRSLQILKELERLEKEQNSKVDQQSLEKLRRKMSSD